MTTIVTPAVGSAAQAALIDYVLSPDRCQVYQTTVQSPASATFTDITFDSEVYDSNNMHSTSSNTNRITIVTAGLYQLSGMITFAFNATGRRGGRWAKNGSIIPIANAAVTYATSVLAASATAVAMPTLTVSCVAGDYLTLQAYQDSGGGLATVTLGTIAEARWVATS